jgi:hypothetical protein
VYYRTRPAVFDAYMDELRRRMALSDIPVVDVSSVRQVPAVAKQA